MKRILSVIVCVFIYLTAMAVNPVNYSFKGVIKDKKTGESLPYISVYIEELSGNKFESVPGHRHRFEHSYNLSYMSDEKGEFLANVPHDGRYEVKVTGVGYLPLVKTIEVKNGKSPDLELMLDTQVFQTPEVVVSANRNETNRKDAPVIVNVLNMKTFETVNSCDLSKALNFQSGLRVETDCQNCGFSQVRINGLDGPYSQILIDSRPVLSALAGVYGLEQLPTNMIDRVEIVRGGGSALFGSNAVAGTINIITKDPVNNSFRAATNFTAINGNAWESVVDGNVSLVSDDHKYGLSAYQFFRKRSPVDIDGDGFSELPKLDSRNFGMRGFLRPTKMSRLTLEYHTAYEYRRGGNMFDEPPHKADIAEQTNHYINGGSATYDIFFKEYKHKLSLYGSLQHISRDSYYGSHQDENAYGKTTDMTWVTGGTYVLNYSHFLFSPGTFTAGVEYQSNGLKDEMTGYNRHLDQQVKIGSGYFQNEWKDNYYSILVGARVDKHNLIHRLIFSPRVNFLYKPSEAVQSRLTFSTGFRAPQAYDEDLHVSMVGGQGMVIKLAPNLKEERSLSYSASVDLYGNWGVWQGNLLGEAFYTDLRNVFVLEPLPDENGYSVQERRNGKGARVYGINLDGKLAYGNLSQLQMGFTLQRSRYKADHIWSDEAAPVRNMLRTPDYYGYLTYTYNVTKAFKVYLSGTFTGKMYVPHFAGYIRHDRLEQSPLFFDMSPKLSYDFKLYRNLILQVDAGVQNIFDSRQRDFDKNADRDSQYIYGPSQPRSYYVGFKLMNL